MEQLSAPAQAAILCEKRFSPSKLAALVEAATDLGLDITEILAGTALRIEDLADPFLLTSTQQFLTAARTSIRLYPYPDLGARVGRLLHASSYGMFGYAVLCAGTLAATFDSAVKFHRLANGVLNIRWDTQNDVASWHFPAQHATELPELGRQLYRFLLDMQFAVHVTVIKDTMGAWCIPTCAQVTYAPSAHTALLAEILECPLSFNQPANVLSYPAAWLHYPPQLAHSLTAAQVSRQCAVLLNELQSQSEITTRVYEALTRTPGKFPQLATIADELCMTERTLRRKLEAASTSYNELLASVRRALAIDYLTTTSMSTEDIAEALGFSDTVGFRRAFKRWTNTTPHEVRLGREEWISRLKAQTDQGP